jgi:hypothetical protein
MVSDSQRAQYVPGDPLPNPFKTQTSRGYINPREGDKNPPTRLSPAIDRGGSLAYQVFLEIIEVVSSKTNKK